MSIRVAKRLKTAAVSISSATDTVVVSSSASTRISIVRIFLRSSGGTNTITLKSRGTDNTTLTSLSGGIATASTEVINVGGTLDSPALGPLDADCDFVITTGSANAVVGWVTYTQETV